MKLIKFLLMVLLGIVAIWIGLMLLGLVGTLVHVLFWLAILYVVGMIVWKLLAGGSDKPAGARQLQEMEQASKRLAEASQRLEELKRRQRVNQ